MSFKFPSNKDSKKRFCFQCKKSIDFGDYYVRNKSLNEERLIKLWENHNLEFYCCLCYDEILKQEEYEMVYNNLSEESKDFIEILERKLKSKIPIISEIKYHTVGYNVKNNRIYELSLFNCIKELPDEIMFIDSLEYLSLAWNYLTNFPIPICNLKNLKKLDLIGNNFTIIPKEIRQLTSLEELDLSFNELKTIPDDIFRLTLLKRLNLIHNKLIKFPDSLKNIEIKGLNVLL